MHFMNVGHLDKVSMAKIVKGVGIRRKSLEFQPVHHAVDVG
jgi:hypothetical protein